MPARIMLVNPARHFIANAHGLGYLTPLGLVFLGGPLIDAGHDVKLIDHDMNGWPMQRLLQEIEEFGPKYILLGHSGSTASHTVVVRTVQQIREAFPETRIIYGGVYPSYAYQSILQEVPQIDVIVRGEGEKTILDLISTWERDEDLEEVKGIAWRKNNQIVINHPQPAIQNLNQYRPAWELLEWDRYQMFGFDHAAGLQFSRGCTLTCSYCGQWMFWKKWRHRSPQNIVDDMKLLKEKYGVNLIWFADENFAADRELAKELLEKIASADLNLSLNLNMTAADVVRDADLLPLYKRAGVDERSCDRGYSKEQSVCNFEGGGPAAARESHYQPDEYHLWPRGGIVEHDFREIQGHAGIGFGHPQCDVSDAAFLDLRWKIHGSRDDHSAGSCKMVLSKPGACHTPSQAAFVVCRDKVYRSTLSSAAAGVVSIDRPSRQTLFEDHATFHAHRCPRDPGGTLGIFLRHKICATGQHG
jgi:hypothetical protein